MSYKVQFTQKSTNVKIGAMPASITSKDTCPPACPLLANGCYAGSGPLGVIWNALSRAKPNSAYTSGVATMQAHSWYQFTRQVWNLPAGTLWRHNQAGDLPGKQNKIDAKALKSLVTANQGKHGFTYTHYPLTRLNARAIRHANKYGFTINLSANNLEHADRLAQTDIGPVVTILPSEVQGNAKLFTPHGRRVVVCPATYRDDVTCKSCKLCAVRDRQVIIGFPAHGASKRKASNVAKGE